MKAGGGARVWLSMRNAAGTEQGREAARLPGPLGNAAHLPLLGQRRAAAGGGSGPPHGLARRCPRGSLPRALRRRRARSLGSPVSSR